MRTHPAVEVVALVTVRTPGPTVSAIQPMTLTPLYDWRFEIQMPESIAVGDTMRTTGRKSTAEPMVVVALADWK